jgi:hypothetical protein
VAVPSDRVAVGVRAHSGWAVVAVVGGTIEAPRILDRRRIEIVPDDQAYRQPYHAAVELGVKNGRALVKRSAEHAEKASLVALRDIERAVAPRRVASCAILAPLLKGPIRLEDALRSHALVHTAEGLLFREAVARAAVTCGLSVCAFFEREILAEASGTWRWNQDRLERRLSELRREVGPPWTRDEKLATVAGLLALGT